MTITFFVAGQATFWQGGGEGASGENPRKGLSAPTPSPGVMSDAENEQIRIV